MMVVDAANSQGNNIMMKEVNNNSSISIEKQPLEVLTSRNEAENNSVNDESSTLVVIDHGKRLMSIWKTFGGNTRDLGSYGEETDKTTNLHQHLSRISTQKLETASQITRDAVTTHLKTASQDLKTAYGYSGVAEGDLRKFSDTGACDSLLLTPLCCDDIHDVTPRVSALAGCDRLVSEPVMFSPTRKKSRWGTVFPTGLKRYKEPLVEPKEIG
ncbi:hypothetical protein Tco_0008416 [Tanacetum coccineum]